MPRIILLLNDEQLDEISFVQESDLINAAIWWTDLAPRDLSALILAGAGSTRQPDARNT